MRRRVLRSRSGGQPDSGPSNSGARSAFGGVRQKNHRDAVSSHNRLASLRCMCACLVSLSRSRLSLLMHVYALVVLLHVAPTLLSLC